MSSGTSFGRLILRWLGFFAICGYFLLLTLSTSERFGRSWSLVNDWYRETRIIFCLAMMISLIFIFAQRKIGFYLMTLSMLALWVIRLQDDYFDHISRLPGGGWGFFFDTIAQLILLFVVIRHYRALR